MRYFVVHRNTIEKGILYQVHDRRTMSSIHTFKPEKYKSCLDAKMAAESFAHRLNTGA